MEVINITFGDEMDFFDEINNSMIANAFEQLSNFGIRYPHSFTDHRHRHRLWLSFLFFLSFS